VVVAVLLAEVVPTPALWAVERVKPPDLMGLSEALPRADLNSVVV
jgi:hypothetical protein